MTLEAGLDKIAAVGAELTKAVNANTENPLMISLIEKLIKALDRNTNTLLGQRGTTPPAENNSVEQAPETESSKPAKKAAPEKIKEGKVAKPAAKSDAKIEYSTLAKKGLALIDLKGKDYFINFLQEHDGLTNLKQAHVDSYPMLNDALDQELANG